MKTIPEGRRFAVRLRVTPQMTARFFDCEIHPLYATFALVEHAEYVGRCAILPYLEADEDAVGNAVEIAHSAPAKAGEIVRVEAQVQQVEGRTILCAVTAWNGDRIIARGSTTQRVITSRR